LPPQGDNLDDFPQISEALILAIKRRLPGPWPDLNMTLREIDKMAGSYAIVTLLEFVFDHQARQANPPPPEEEEAEDRFNNVLRFP